MLERARSATRAEAPYRRLRALVGTVFIGAFEYGFITKWMEGARIDSLWVLAQLILLVAAGIAVFGRETFTDATETAQDIKEGEEGGDE